MSSSTPTQRQAALISGLAYVAIIVLAFFANFFVLERLTDPDDAAATVGDIAGSELLFRGGVVAFIVVFILDVVVAWGLYIFLRPAGRELSLFAAWFRLIAATVSLAALLNLLIAAKLVDDTGYPVGQRSAHVMLFLDAYTYGWSIGLVCFGVHLLLLGLLIVRSDHAPRLLGILVAVAGLAYVVGKLASVLLPDHNDTFLLLIAVLAIPGEFGLTGWLLWRGGKDTPTSHQQPEVATTGTA